jgi:hypothetical protein
MTSRPATQATSARSASSGLPPAVQNQHHMPCDRGGYPAVGPEADLDAYIARLVDQAPPLSSEQRDTLALILRRSCPTPAGPSGAGTPDPVPQRVDPFHGI